MFPIFPSMAKLPILEFPDPRLRTVAKPVELVDDALRSLVDDMFETMYAAPGIGLAATQVDVHQRLLVLDVSEDQSRPMVFINPEILSAEGHQVYQEGCLSVPGIYDGVERSIAVRVRALDGSGVERTLEAEDMLAVCIQHEMDHLMGRVFVEYLSPLKRNRIKGKLLKAQRETERA